MTIQEKLAILREKMKENNMDIYMIPTADFHQSEYVGEYFKARSYMSGFTGSAGTLVVTLTEVCGPTVVILFRQSSSLQAAPSHCTVCLRKAYLQ